MKYTSIILLLLINVAAYAQSPLSNSDSFVAENHPEIVAEFADRDDSAEITEAFIDAGGNWTNLYNAVSAFDDQKREDCIFLIKIMPHLDRLEMTSDTLIEHVEYAWKAKEDFAYTIPEDMFREYILVYRLGDEPVIPYRSEIRRRFSDLAGETPSDTARAVNRWIFENIRELPRGFFGASPSPTEVLTSGGGTPEDIANLTTAMLKTLGVPSRRVSTEAFGSQAGGASWVEIYDNGWLPLYPNTPDAFGDFNYWERDKPSNITVVSAQSAFNATQITPQYSATGVLELKFMRRGLPVTDFENFGIAVYNDGGFIPLDAIWDSLDNPDAATDEGDVEKVILGNGRYLVECGVRNTDGDPWVQTRMVDLAAGEVKTLEFNVDPPIGDLKQADLLERKIEPLPVFQVDGNEYPSSFAGQAHVVIIFDTEGEPSLRMLPEIMRFTKENSGPLKALFICVSPEEKKAEATETMTKLGVDPGQVLWDTTGDIAKAWGCPIDDATSRFTALPAIALINADGIVILYDEGYNLMVYDYLVRGLDFIG